MPGSDAAADARVALLQRLFDHAPLFPPASLPLAEALAEDRRARACAHAFMLGRFVVPASRLAELGDEPRRLSVLADGPVADDPRVETIEVPPGRKVEAAGSRMRPTYFELPSGPSGLEGEIEPLAAPGRAGVKVRCGGAATPSVEALAAVVRRCREHGVPLKATAGLHHAVRRGDEHGFLNLLAAVVFADEEAALADGDPAAFALDARSFRWRDRAAGPEELATARRTQLHAIGSCSFFEPMEELEALGLLPRSWPDPGGPLP